MFMNNISRIPTAALVEQALYSDDHAFNSSVDNNKTLMRRIEATDGLIDQIVYRLYGLNEKEIKIVEESASGKLKKIPVITLENIENQIFSFNNLQEKAFISNRISLAIFEKPFLQFLANSLSSRKKSIGFISFRFVINSRKMRSS